MEQGPGKLRTDLEFIPIEHEGKRLVLVRDQLGLVPEGRVLTVDMVRMLTALEKAASFEELQHLFTRMQGGLFVGMDEVKQFMSELDKAYLLDTQRYRIARGQVVEAFIQSTVRMAGHCGRSYPGGPEELKGELDAILSAAPNDAPESPVRALVAPHIDLRVGGTCYARAYGSLRGASPDRVVVLGVGHAMTEEMFSLTGKDFQTPLGTVKNEPDTVKELLTCADGLFTENDFPHRDEHSVEFQVLFLQHVLPKDSFTIIPVLCGAPAWLPDYTRQAYLDTAGPFLDKLRSMIGEPGRQTLVVAGVDFSHIGPKFGHHSPSSSLEGPAREHDARLLECLVGGDPDGFWEESARVGDRYNVCGFSAMACLLEVLPDPRGRVLAHDIWHERATNSAVTFAAVAFR